MKLTLFNIPAGTPFLACLADALILGTLPGMDPASDAGDFSDITLFLPTRRAARTFTELLWKRTGLDAIMLPDIRPLGDIDEVVVQATAGDEGDGPADIVAPPAIPAIERQFVVAGLLRKWSEEQAVSRTDGLTLYDSVRSNPVHALNLASALCKLIDTAETEKILLTDLSALVLEEFAANWQVTADLLAEVVTRLRDHMERMGVVGPAARRNFLLQAAADGLPVQSSGPVIAAGSTGSIPATATLLAAIAAQPGGCVILPGLDQTMDDNSWSALPPSHPQFGLSQLLGRLGADRKDVEALPGSKPGVINADRTGLVSEIMRPAETTDEWHDRLSALEPAGLARAMEGLHIVSVDREREEAQVISLLLRAALNEPDRTAALITPDRALARRVAAELERWGVLVDDSAGRPLRTSPPGIVLILIALAVVEDFEPVALLAMLKHPLTTVGWSRGTLLRATRIIELAALRGARPAPGLNGLKQALRNAREHGDKRGVHPAVANMADTDWDLAAALVDRLEGALGPLVELCSAGGHKQFTEMLRCHIDAAQALTAIDPENDADRKPALWHADAGRDLADLCDDILSTARIDCPCQATHYPAMLDSLLRQATTRPSASRHPRLHIWGLLEARLLSADCLVLGGVNEDTWPGAAAADPWLNRPMRAELGLQQPERQIGLAAHDFAQALCSSDVYVTRAAKQDGAPTVASRWVLRLTAMLEAGLAGEGAITPQPWLNWARSLDSVTMETALPPPEPRPPVAVRPRRLSVTQVEEWIRDPYAIYARHILRLEPLDQLDMDPGAADRGLMIHEILNRFTALADGDLEADAHARLVSIGREVFADYIARPGVAAFWWPRFENIAGWFIEQEKHLGKDISKRLCEVRGRLEFNGPAGSFELVARADRIDVLTSGGARILDYKTGQVPSIDQVSAAFSPQLPLEGKMVADGGFDGLGPCVPEAFVYVRLTGGAPPGEVRFVSSGKRPPEEIIDRAWQGLVRRVALFDNPETPYLPSVARDFELRPRAFDHLARYREWAVNPVTRTGPQ